MHRGNAAALHGHCLGLHFARLQVDEEIARLDVGLLFLAEHAHGQPLVVLQREHGEHRVHLRHVEREHLAGAAVVQAPRRHFQLCGASARDGQAGELPLGRDGVAHDVLGRLIGPGLGAVEVGGLQLLPVAVDDLLFHVISSG